MSVEYVAFGVEPHFLELNPNWEAIIEGELDESCDFFGFGVVPIMSYEVMRALLGEAHVVKFSDEVEGPQVLCIPS